MSTSPATPLANLPIGALSRLTGCNIETIRYYERIELLPAPPRTPGGRRCYAPAHVKLLTFIRRARELGFTLDDVRSLLRLVETGDSTCNEVRAITAEHLREVTSKIVDLQRLQAVLERMVGECDGATQPGCPIIETLRRSS